MAWNAQFADFDNDEFSRLFLTNGLQHKPLNGYSNVFYKNVEGGKDGE